MKWGIGSRKGDEKIIEIDDISADGRAHLLDLAYARLRFGLAMMPLIASLFAWYYQYEDHPHPDYRVLIWTLTYTAFSGLSLLLYKVYRQDKIHLSAQEILKKYLPAVHGMALVHGLAIAALLPLVQHTASQEYKYLYLVVIVAIIAGNATHQSPMLSVFRRFLYCWHATVIMLPWTLSDNWHFFTPMALMYSAGMYRYSKMSHQFFVRMIWLEEESKRLADSYKSAKEEVEAALKAKNQFLTTASHDLRQPVHAMGFLVESIAFRNKDQTLLPALKDLKQSLHTVTQMFGALLDLSKIESGKVKIQIGRVYLDALAREVTTIFAEEARAQSETSCMDWQGKCCNQS